LCIYCKLLYGYFLEFSWYGNDYRMIVIELFDWFRHSYIFQVKSCTQKAVV
jgi:hypothetical protein